MRYRNRIKLAPGININLSKSGISTTLGPRGANINVGKSGTYLNTGLPGTGLYDRTKISNPNTGSVKSSNSNITNVGVQLDLDENYQPVIVIYDNYGRNITNSTLVNKVKKTHEYKANLNTIYQKYHEDILNETKDLTDLYKQTIKPVSREEIQLQLNELKPKKYEKLSFDRREPNRRTIQNLLEAEASSKFNSLLFWKNKKNREDYVKDNLDERFKIDYTNWSKGNQDFISKELIKEKEENEKFKEEYQIQINLLNKNLEGAEDLVMYNFEKLLNDVDIKPEFSLDFEYDPENKIFKIDLDLPEEEHIPRETASILQSEKISVKKKIEKQIREEYAYCVAGLAYYIAGISFMSASGIKKVVISGYTQRIDKKDGQIKDDYIYSIEFDRKNFSSLNFTSIDPIIAFDNFPNAMELSKTFVFNRIL